MSEPAVDVCLVTWNGERVLPTCLASLERQTYQNKNFFFLDNGSADHSAAIAGSWLEEHGTASLLRQETNTGFAKAYNELIRRGSAPYVFVINQDVDLAPDYLEQLVRAMEAGEKLASVSGLLLRMELTKEGLQKTETIDAAGLEIFPSHRVVEKLRGENSQAVSRATPSVFGVPATAALYRRAALEQAHIARAKNAKPEYFDELFDNYKEDVDLAYRLCLLGWESGCVVAALGYHVRGLRGDQTTSALGNVTTITQRQKKKPHQNALSYRNHLLFLGSDFFFPIWSVVWWWTFFYELGKFVVLLVTEPRTVMVLGEIPNLLEQEKIKRQQLRDRGAQTYRVAQWWTLS